MMGEVFHILHCNLTANKQDEQGRYGGQTNHPFGKAKTLPKSGLESH